MLTQNHDCRIRAATYSVLDIPQVRIAHFGESPLKFKASQTWNDSGILTYRKKVVVEKSCIPDILCEL